MWVQLIVGAGTAHAGSEVATRVDAYGDADLSVVSPAVRAGTDVGPVRTEGGYALDVVSGATWALGPDVVSSATTFADVRHAADLSVAFTTERRWTFSAAWAGSFERDYATNAPGVGVRAELLDRTATVSARAGLSAESAWTSTDEDPVARTLGSSLDLDWAQILGPRTTLTARLAAGWLDCDPSLGCQANPYRYVLVTGSAGALALPERHPATRGRAAASARWSQAWTEHVATHLEYRLYRDTWWVTGHTLRLAVAATDPSGRLLVGIDGRGSTQSAAAFARDPAVWSGGETLPGWRTADSRLGGVDDVFLTGRGEWSFFSVGPLVRLGVGAHVDRLWVRYPSAAQATERPAWMVGGGLDAEL